MQIWGKMHSSMKNSAGIFCSIIAITTSVV